MCEDLEGEVRGEGAGGREMEKVGEIGLGGCGGGRWWNGGAGGRRGVRVGGRDVL